VLGRYLIWLITSSSGFSNISNRRTAGSRLEKKNQNQRTVGAGYIRNFKYLLVFMKELKVFWAVIVSFSKTIENCSYISKPDIDFFENHRYEP